MGQPMPRESHNFVSPSGPAGLNRLAGLFRLTVDAGGLWGPADLGPIWRHQLAAALSADRAAAGAAEGAMEPADGFVTFGGLLVNPRPSPVLLAAAFSAAEGHGPRIERPGGPRAGLPAEVARLLRCAAPPPPGPARPSG